MIAIKSYGIEVVGAGRAMFQETINIYRNAVSYLVGVCHREWALISSFEGDKEKQRCLESLTHSTGERRSKKTGEIISAANIAKYDFDQQFPKFPSYFRRAALDAAIGAVSSYKKNYSNWLAGGRQGKPPKLTLDRNVMPVFFKKNMSQPIDRQNGTIRLKLFRNHDWVWVTIRLKKTDLKYITKYMSAFEESSPVLIKRCGKYEIRFTYKRNVPLTPKEEILTQPILAVDLGLNSDAVCTILTVEGTVLGRKFIDFAGEKDHLYTVPGRISKKQREHGPGSAGDLWKYARNLNDALADKIAAAIVDYAVMWGASVIVFEYLDFRGKKGYGSKARKLNMWRKNDIQHKTECKAHWWGIRISHVCAWGTSSLAYDGSGKVTRNKKNRALCTFSTGKQYNADLSASYNIGARYIIRELLKPLPETVKSKALAKVPEASRRTLCTLSTLRALYPELVRLTQKAQSA